MATRLDDAIPAIRDHFSRSTDLIVLDVDITHEHGDSLMGGQGHADLERDARIGDVGGGAMTNAVGADMDDPACFQDAAPGAPIAVFAQPLPRVVDPRDDIG